jgi:hypothetical protein
MLPANLVEEYLTRAEWSWRMSRFLQRSAVIGIATLGCLLVLGAICSSRLAEQPGARRAAPRSHTPRVRHGLAGHRAGHLDRATRSRRLGMELEHVEPRLLDRVNALVHLEGKLEKSSPFLVHLAGQSAEVLTTPGAGRPRIAPQVVRTLALLLVVTLITAAFYRLVQPFQHIRQAELAAAELRKQNDEDPDRLVIPDDTWLEETPAESGRRGRATVDGNPHPRPRTRSAGHAVRSDSPGHRSLLHRTTRRNSPDHRGAGKGTRADPPFPHPRIPTTPFRNMNSICSRSMWPSGM